MGLLEFLAAVIGSLAWPVVVLVSVILLRKPLAELIPLLRRLKYKGLAVEFEAGLREVERDLNTAPDAPALKRGVEEPKQLLASVDTDPQAYFEGIARVSPVAAILEAWQEFEMVATAGLKRQSRFPRGAPPSMNRLFTLLRESSLITKVEERSLVTLRALRNTAVHEADVFDATVSPDEAAVFAVILSGITESIRRRLGE